MVTSSMAISGSLTPARSPTQVQCKVLRVMTGRTVLTVLPARPGRKALRVPMVRKGLQVLQVATAPFGVLARERRTTAPVWTVISGWMSAQVMCTSVRLARILS
jgi:hypothetical protein